MPVSMATNLWPAATTMAHDRHHAVGIWDPEGRNRPHQHERDIYFIPVVSPDSYPKSRIVDKVDPNRDFPHLGRPNHKSIPPSMPCKNSF